ncbi:MAG: MFS transporter [Propionibacteriaceae bacterium]|nr:MFS transporter [Propionibacteriaceae bacterium]
MSRENPSDSPVLVASTGRVLPHDWLRVIALIWGGQSFSIITSYASGYAAIWYVTETTESAMMLSLTTIFAILPIGLLSPFGGVLADRVNRRTIMLISDVSVGVLSAILGVVILLGQTSLTIIMVIVTGRAIAQAFRTPALTSAAPMLVPEKHLLRLNSLNQLIWSVAGIGAPALGIFLYTVIGFQAVMFLDASGAFMAAVCLWFVKIPTAKNLEAAQQNVLANLRDGLMTIYRNAGLFQLMLICTVAMLIFQPVGALFPLMTKEHFGGGGYHASLIEGVFGIALLAGSLVLMAWGGGKRHLVLLLFTGLGFGVTTAASGLLSSDMFWAFAVLCVLMGFVCAFYNGPLTTIIQRHTPEEKLGRVMGLFGSVVSLASPIGLVIAGTAAEVTGIANWFLISGLVMIVVCLCAFLFPAVLALDKRDTAEATPAEAEQPDSIA